MKTGTCSCANTFRLLIFAVVGLALVMLLIHEYSQRQVFKTRFSLLIDEQPISVRVAARFVEQAQGLMHCERLGSDEGMLFVFASAEPLSFWMKDTPLPLDVGFFDSNGVLCEVRSLSALDETVIRAKQPGQFALEMSQGWFARHQVRPGAQLALAMVRAALSRR